MDAPENDHLSVQGHGGQNFLAGLLAACTRTDEFKNLAASLMQELLGSWAGKSRLKKIAAFPVKWITGRIFRVKKKDLQATPVKDFLDDADTSQIGAVITSAAGYLNRVHQENPLYLSEKFGPAMSAVIAATDFGEIKEMVTGSSEDFAELARVVNEDMWQYPAKVVLLLSLVPDLLNIILASLVHTIRPFNNIAPDLLCDVVVSLIHDMDRETIGKLVNELSELVRKVHTGSALIGEGGKYAFPAEVSDLMSGIIRSIDIPLLLKSRDMLGEIKRLIELSFIDILEDNPDYAADYFQSHFRSLTSLVRSWSIKADAFERLFTDEDVAREFASGMGELDAQDMADTINRLCLLFNNVRQHTPGTIKNFLTQHFASLEPSILSETAAWLIDDIVSSLKPLAPEIMPPVINGIAELIAPDGEASAEMKNAWANLRKSIKCMEEDHE